MNKTRNHIVARLYGINRHYRTMNSVHAKNDGTMLIMYGDCFVRHCDNETLQRINSGVMSVDEAELLQYAYQSK